MCSINEDRLFKGFLFTMWTFFPLGLIFISLLAGKIDKTVNLSWWLVFAPLYAFQAFLLATSPIFFIYFPDRSFLEDRVGPSFGKSIKPRYRVNMLYLTAAVLNLPIALFNVFLCLHLQHGLIPWAAVFSPLFIAEIAALARTSIWESNAKPSFFFLQVLPQPPLTHLPFKVLIGLISARAHRGTYCVRVDAGPGIAIREIW